MTSVDWDAMLCAYWTGSYKIEGNLWDLVPKQTCELWHRQAIDEELYPEEKSDPVAAAKRITLWLNYIAPGTENAPGWFEWVLWLKSEEGRHLALIGEPDEHITPRVDSDTHALGSPLTLQWVNGHSKTTCAPWDEIRKYLPVNITQQLASLTDLGSWVSECLARTWAYHHGYIDNFHLPQEDLIEAWKKVAHPLYSEALTGWVQYTIPARTGSGTPRHETIWTNHTPSTLI